MYYDPFRILLVLFFILVFVFLIIGHTFDAIEEHKAKKLEKQKKI